jgi:hypothetical protein
MVLATLRGLWLIAFVSVIGCNPIANIRELERGGKMYKQRADDIKDAVQATDNRLPPDSDQQ